MVVQLTKHSKFSPLYIPTFYSQICKEFVEITEFFSELEAEWGSDTFLEITKKDLGITKIDTQSEVEIYISVGERLSDFIHKCS